MHNNPFDDPEFREQMARMGVRHSPGMADELMRELAPLMKADGVDLDAPGTVDLDELSAAMASAVERRNMELMTPIGAHHGQALATLREFSVAIADDNEALAQEIIGSIEPDPTPDAPSVAHVISTAVETVAAWHADPSFARATARTRVPAWARKPSRKAASDVLALAPKGRALAAIDSLIRRHGGLLVIEGSALAVAGLLIARATADGTSVADLGTELLGSVPAPTKRASASGSAFVRAQDPEQDVAVEEFIAWIDDRYDNLTEELARDLDDLIDAFDAVVTYAESARLDVRVAAHIPPLLDAIGDELDEDPVLLQAIDEYVGFRIESGTDPAGWAAAREAINERIRETDGAASAIADAIARGEDVPPADLDAALDRARLIQATRDLVAWIGDGRPVTETGLPRRSDIATVAGMFGVTAHGSARRVPGDPSAVRSLLDLPAVATWWEALAVLGIIALTPTRVHLGEESDAWLSHAPDRAREAVVITYVGLTLRIPDPTEPFLRAASGYAVARIAAAFEGIHEDLPADDLLLAMTIGHSILERLDTAGIVEIDDEGTLHIPDALHPLVARGLMLAMAIDNGEV